MLHIHPDARATPAVRAEIARSAEPSGTVARRHGISAETVRRWRKRGAADCLGCLAHPHRLPWKVTDEERAVVRILRRATNSPSTTSPSCSLTSCPTLTATASGAS